MKTVFEVKRATTESQITAQLDFSGLKPDYRKYIDTPIPFLNHMIEHIAWRAGINIALQMKLDRFDLAHVVCEDAAITLGRAVLEYVTANGPLGVTGYGDGVGIIDEARATCAVSFEGRTGFYFSSQAEVPAETEHMLSEDVVTFLEGFAQGARCTLHIHIERGENGHHIWEAVFRSLGIALGRALAIDPKRVGMSAGVAGTIEFEVV